MVCAVPRDFHLNTDRAQKGPACAPEGDHECIADRLHLEAAMLGDLIPHDRVVLAQKREPADVPELLGQQRRTPYIGEQSVTVPSGAARVWKLTCSRSTASVTASRLVGKDCPMG